MEESSHGPVPADTRPIPDPTELTTKAVDAAREQWRLDLESMREIIEARLDAMDIATNLQIKAVENEPQRMALLVTNLELLLTEKFRSVELQFKERDTRTEQAAIASKQALDAALLAAKELVGQQNTANVEAAAKAETSFTKQIDQTSVLITTLEKALTDRILELKERMDRGEGRVIGVTDTRTDQRLNLGQVLLVVSLVIAAAGVIVAIIVARA